jgi:hypothetical protein
MLAGLSVLSFTFAGDILDLKIISDQQRAIRHLGAAESEIA